MDNKDINMQNFDPDKGNKEEDTEEVLEQEIDDDDYQFTEKGFEFDKE